MNANKKNSRPQLLAALLIGALLLPFTAGADNYDLMKGKPSVTTPPPPPPQYKNSNTALDCSKPNNSPQCRPPAPDYRPYPSYRRPVIINQTPPTPPLDISTLKDDWDGCRAAKLVAIHSRHDGQLEQANRLDEWLWKNCRSYSEELRDLEQDQM